MSDCSNNNTSLPHGVDGKDGIDGVDGAAGVCIPCADGAPGVDGNTIFTTSDAAPNPLTGQNGDFSIDIANQIMYGPKTNAVWGSGFSLVGSTGPAVKVLIHNQEFATQQQPGGIGSSSAQLMSQVLLYTNLASINSLTTEGSTLEIEIEWIKTIVLAEFISELRIFGTTININSNPYLSGASHGKILILLTRTSSANYTGSIDFTSYSAVGGGLLASSSSRQRFSGSGVDWTQDFDVEMFVERTPTSIDGALGVDQIIVKKLIR